MKTILVPYTQTDAGWWTGLDVYNYNDYSTVIKVEVENSKGNRQHLIEEEVEGKEHLLLDNTKLKVQSDSGRATIVITCDDNVFATTFLGQDGSTFFSLLQGVEVEK